MKNAVKVMLAALVLIVAGAAVVGYVLFAPRSASPLGPGAGARLRDYLGSQIVGIVNAHLVPQLGFSTIDYEAPYTVHLSGVTLTAPDGTCVLDVEGLVITLAETPGLDRPIKIARVSIDGGDLRIMQDPQSGEILGFDQLTRVRSRQTLRQVPESQNLSSVLVLQRVTIRDVSLTYDDGAGQPMTLSGFACDMTIRPDDLGPGWYTLDMQAGRSPGLETTLRGAFNIDQFLLDLRDSRARIALDPTTISTLPPQLQGFLTRFDAAGSAVLDFRGSVPIGDLEQSNLTGWLNVREFNVVVSDYRLPIRLAEADIAMADGQVTISNFRAQTLAGLVQAHASVDLSAAGSPAVAEWTLQNLNLREALRAAAPPGATPNLAGNLNGKGSASLMIDDPLARISGSGQMQVRNGRLLVLPGLAELVQKIGNLDFRDDATFGHEADVDYLLEPAGVRITRSSVITGIVAADAVGLVGYDGSIDLSVRAGPLKRLTGQLGLLGRAIGSVTERLVAYRIQGTVDRPQVTIQPLGIGG
ncbi:MAG: AsmA family protein [Phycisphaerales bacterium]|nr:AsmA family protein [Phycisphaerales bacterium]